MTPLLWFTVVLLVLHGMMALVAVGNYTLAPKLEPEGEPRRPDGPDPRVSVIIPARDEERSIEACVRGFLAQDTPNLEIIVVDDGSTDRTPEILADLVRQQEGRTPELRVIRSPPRPPGWAGKNHAVHQGTLAAQGEWLAFADADTRHAPYSLRRCLDWALTEESDLLTLVPEMVTESVAERVVMPVIVQMILVFFSARDVNDPSKATASANGPFILFRRSAYEQIGGHEAVKGDVVEDLTLAKKTKDAGLTLSYLVAPELYRLRMYESLSEIYWGFSKNFYIGLGGNPVAALLAGGLIGVFYLGPWLLLPLGGWVALGGLGAVALDLWTRHYLKRRYKLDASLALLQPLGAAFVLLILLNSTWRGLVGAPARWKGDATGARPDPAASASGEPPT